jgi:hypothetical protein
MTFVVVAALLQGCAGTRKPTTVCVPPMNRIDQ